MAEPWEAYQQSPQPQTKVVGKDEPWEAYQQAAAPVVPEESLPWTDRAKLSFADSPEEAQGYLLQKYPGAQLGKFGESDTIQIPGEDKPRWVKGPGLAGKLADYASAVPEVGTAAGVGLLSEGGGLLVPGLAMAAGTAAKKGIKSLVGVPSYQSTAQNLSDIAASGVGAATGEGLLARLPGAQYLKNLGKFGTETTSAEVGKTATESAKETVGNAIPPPQSDAELNAAIERGRSAGYLRQRPEASLVQDSEESLKHLNLTPLLPVQAKAVEDAGTNKVYQAIKSDPTHPLSKPLNDIESIQRAEMHDAIDNTIEEHAGRAPIDDHAQAGQALIDSLNNKYQSTKDALGPVFEHYKSLEIDPSKHVAELSEKIGSAFPDLKNYLKFEPGVRPNGEQALIPSLKPYSMKSGMDEQTYNTIGSVIKELNSESLSVPQIQAIRETLRQKIDPLDAASQPLMKLRKVMLDHLQDIITKADPEAGAGVKKTFQEYAVNESNLNELQKQLGGSFSKNAKTTEKIVPETVMDKAFRNSNTVKLLKNVLGDDFGEHAGDYLNSLKTKATSNDNVLSSKKFSSQLRNKDAVLNEAFSDAPEVLNTVRALSDRLRLVPDATQYPNSQTAPATNIYEKLKGAARFMGMAAQRPHEALPEALSKVAEGIKGTLEKSKTEAEKNALLYGIEPPENTTRPFLKRAAKAYIGSKGAQGLMNISKGQQNAQ